MAFFDEFPHTRTYDSDLAWLIKRMKEVLARMDSVEARMKALEDLVRDFIASLDIDQAIRDALEQMIADGIFNELLTQLFNEYTQTINNRMDLQDTAITNFINNVTAQLANYYTKSEIDTMLGGIGQLISDLDATIIASASKPRAVIYVTGDGDSQYQYVFGAANYLRGRIGQNVGTTGIGALDTNNHTIRKIDLLDESFTGLTIPISGLYDLFALPRDGGGTRGSAIIYSGAAFTSMPPYSAGGPCATGSMAIQHTIRDNKNLFFRLAGSGFSSPFFICNGLIDNINVNAGSVGFPTNDEIRTLLP